MTDNDDQGKDSTTAQSVKLTGLKLKPCPFCGSGPARNVQNASFSGVELLESDMFFWGNCGTCGTEGPKEATETEAIAAWNTGTDTIPDPEAIARAALEAAAKLFDQDAKEMRAEGSASYWEAEADAKRIRALMDPAALAEIVKGVKG